MSIRQSRPTAAELQRFRRKRRQQRERQQDRITELLLVELHELCRRHGVELTVALLQDGERGAPTWDLLAVESNDIPFADCRVPLTPELRVPVDSHPNVEVQRMWADCLALALGAP